MQSHVSEFERHQLDVIARVTPHAMAGHILNTSVLAIAVVGSIPAAHLVIWCAYSYAIALVLLYRHIRSRGRVPRSFRRAAVRATVYGVLLALPWGSMAALYLGALAQDQELILVALGVGMAASGSILLSAVPWAALSYMSGILIPSAVKCLAFLNEKGYVLLGVLAASYWWFLAALIAKIAREINERKQADIALKESEIRLQEALQAGQVVAFTLDPSTGLSQRSANAPDILGFASHAGDNQRPGEFLRRVHPDDRARFAAQIKGLSAENPSYSASFRFIRSDGHEVWIEETGKAEFDSAGRYLRLKGLTRDITDRKRAEEQQALLIRELHHRVKNMLATVQAVMGSTARASTTIEEFQRAFTGRIMALARTHSSLAEDQWLAISVRNLLCNELDPYDDGSRRVQLNGPSVDVPSTIAVPLGMAIHELTTNAAKYGALSVLGGSVSVSWALTGEGDRRELDVTWIERDGPTIEPPTRRGFGSQLLERVLTNQIGARATISFEPEGLQARVIVPLPLERSAPTLMDSTGAA
jgi:PAS domain S-box-containing protein